MFFLEKKIRYFSLKFMYFLADLQIRHASCFGEGRVKNEFWPPRAGTEPNLSSLTLLFLLRKKLQC